MPKLSPIAACGLFLLALRTTPAQEKPAPSLTQERVDLARRVYREKLLAALQKRVDPPKSTVAETVEDPIFNEAMAEDLHRWSTRWMEAERDAATNATGREAAVRAHLTRMVDLEDGTTIPHQFADEPLVKELRARKGGDADLRGIADITTKDLDTLGPEWSTVAIRGYRDSSRYFRLEAEAWLIREKAAR